MLHSNVSFANFPHDFLKYDNFILDILGIVAERNIAASKVLNSKQIYFSGCYTQGKVIEKAFNRLKAEFNSSAMTRWLELQYGYENSASFFNKSMWVTFENRRPPEQYFQRSLSFDLDSFSGKNLYLPLWLTYIDFLGTSGSWVRHRVTQDKLLEKRKRKSIEKKFACAFINNPNPVRLRAIHELSKIGPVDVFGRYTNKYVDNKIEKSEEYLFSVCFENDIYPGYITEKPLEAWLGDTVPLYWGNDAAGYLNSSGMINLHDFSSMKDFCSYVGEVFSKKKLYDEIYFQPFLQKTYNVIALIDFFEDWILE